MTLTSLPLITALALLFTHFLVLLDTSLLSLCLGLRLDRLTCALYTMWTPWNTMFFECSDRNSKICSTWASYGRPRNRMQSFRDPEGIN